MMGPNREQLINFYTPASTMTYGGSVYTGLEDIKDRIESFAFKTINYTINDKDVQQGPVNNSLLVTVIGQLTMDQTETFTFFHVFNICPNANGGLYIHNDIFRTIG
jgi:hypothetical protein